MALDYQTLAKNYLAHGYVSPVTFLKEGEAFEHRKRMEVAENKIGSLHYLSKAHTFLTSAWELASKAEVLDLVEKLIGPDILLYNVTYIIKEPNSLSHVSWHQDLTYWGLSHDDQVSMWMALSPATEENGCMKMIPRSHKQGRQKHEVTTDKTNVLLQGQTVTSVDESTAVFCPLNPGQATFHHGWTLHASMPNISSERRIGLNVQYLATHTHQTKHKNDSAILVRGQDRFNYFSKDIPAATDLDPAAMKRQDELEKLYIETAGNS